MTTVTFTDNIQRHVPCPTAKVSAETVRDALEAVFTANEAARGYVLDDRGALRRHMAIFVNGVAIRDRETLSDKVPVDAEIYVMQALSGG
jgi:molybdopterin synthase sulfur carrier subunit